MAPWAIRSQQTPGQTEYLPGGSVRREARDEQRDPGVRAGPGITSLTAMRAVRSSTSGFMSGPFSGQAVHKTVENRR